MSPTFGLRLTLSDRFSLKQKQVEILKCPGEKALPVNSEAAISFRFVFPGKP